MLGRLLKSITQIVGGAVSGASTSRALLTASAQLPADVTANLQRTNHRGEPVSLIAGPVVAAAATSAAMFAAGNKKLAAAALVAGAAAGAVGYYDDIAGNDPNQKADKGFAGHIAALREGRVSAGAVKVAGISAAGLVAGFLLHRKPVDALLAGAVIAGTANLINLLDLRPGRAIKATALLGAPLLTTEARGVAAATIGAAGALVEDDLGERVMLGDCGANALGALLGVGISASTGRKGKLATLAVLGALTAASEKVSFTKVIESTPVLKDIDALGRRPPEPTVALEPQQVNGVAYHASAA